MYSALRNSLIEKDSSFGVDLPFYPLKDVSYSLLHHKELKYRKYQLEPPGVDTIHFVYLNRDRLYTERGNNLYIYSLIDLSSPIARYSLGGWCYSAITNDNRLYLGGYKKLHLFEVASSIT
jgi:hypothetical protein